MAPTGGGLQESRRWGTPKAAAFRRPPSPPDHSRAVAGGRPARSCGHRLPLG
ncbi:hypothetical protein [Amycolatopsis plumensis]|uniref:hypothetical protein n=1 Tax=Amycolatopsis plumensis TaxID=236508 RepID=UPI00361BD36F